MARTLLTWLSCSASPAMDTIRKSCDEHHRYPHNLAKNDAFSFSLNGYYQRLQTESKRIFSSRGAEVHFLDLHKRDQRFSQINMGDVDQLRSYVYKAFEPGKGDPECRFIFLHTRHSRASLQITLGMFQLIMSYHQIPHIFLDFVFPFGQQVAAQDFHFSGILEDPRLDESRRGIEVKELGRSGNEIRFCYNLRSVERRANVIKDDKIPIEEQIIGNWSIVQSAIYHSFDIDTGKSLWIDIKGNTVIRDRVIEASTKPPFPCAKSKIETFKASLETHLLLCDWSAENWRWFINDLETSFENITRDAVMPPTTNGGVFALHLEPSNHKSQEQASGIIPGAIRSFTRRSTNLRSASIPTQTVGRDQVEQQQLPPIPSSVKSYEKGFTFNTLQSIQRIEEQAHKSLLNIRLNSNVLEDLRKHYENAIDHANFPVCIKSECKYDIFRFKRMVMRAEKNLSMLRPRTENLLELLQNRKNLINGILQHNSIQASQSSADNMTKMTVQMHQLAIKTRHETISMRIITLVTLFFLPGTFVATFMSTEFLTYNEGKKILQREGLELYLQITLPLTAITFLAWGLMYQFTKKKDLIE